MHLVPLTSPEPFDRGNTQSCGRNCGVQTGPAADRTYALDQTQQIVDRNASPLNPEQPPSPFAAFSPDYVPPPRIYSPPPVNDPKYYETRYTYSRRAPQFERPPWNYSWTEQQALQEQLEAVRYFGLQNTDWKLVSEWISSEGGWSKRLVYRLLNKSDIPVPEIDIPHDLDKFIQDQIDQITNERPLERILISSSDPPAGISAGQLARLFPILATDADPEGETSGIYHRITLDPWNLKPPLHQLRIILSDAADREQLSDDLVVNLRDVITKTAQYWVRDGFVDLRLWPASHNQLEQWMDNWALKMDSDIKLAWPKSEYWSQLPVSTQTEYESWNWPGWNRSQLLLQLLSPESSPYYWQHWPVQSSWWATVAALYQSWPNTWSAPYILGQGSNMVIWGWPMQDLRSSNTKQLSQVYQSMLVNVQQARSWPGVHVLYNPIPRTVPTTSIRNIVSVPIINDNLYRQVWIVILASSDLALTGYNAAIDNLDLWNHFTTSEPINKELLDIKPLRLGPLPTFISRSIEMGYLANLRDWINNILHMLAMPNGTFTITPVGKCLEIELFDDQDRPVSWDQVRPLPFDITIWSQYQYLTSDPRWLLTELLPPQVARWGPGFIGDRSPADPVIQNAFLGTPSEFANYNYYEQNEMIPSDLLWTDYWTLNEVDVKTIGDFSFWNMHHDHTIGDQFRALQLGELLVWTIPQWLNQWVANFQEALQVKYTLQANNLIHQQSDIPGLQILLDGTLQLRAANRSQANKLLTTAYHALATTPWMTLTVTSQPPSSGLKLPRSISWDNKHWIVE